MKSKQDEKVSLSIIVGLLIVLGSGHTIAGTPISTISLAWTPGDNPTGTEHLLFWGVQIGVYTNLANPLRIPYAQTNCTVSNLFSGTRYYFVVQETDGVDVSPFSNECMAKTKLNPPKNASASAP